MTKNMARKNTQSGAALILFLIIFPCLLAVGSFTLELQRAAAMETKLQRIVDAAAHTGTSALCSTLECWQNGRMLALKHLLAEVGVESIRRINIEENDPNGNPVLTWQGEDFILHIERGQWSEIAEFQSLEEGSNFTFTQFPNRLLVNSIHISLTVTQKPLLPPPISKPIVVSVESLSTLPNTGTSCVAPFALPICALLNDDGEYDTDEICSADRIFTESKRYCNPGEDCDVSPDFPWEPVMSTELNRNGVYRYEESFAELFGWFHPEIDMSYFWASPHFKERGDHFGVVGLPGKGPVTESIIQGKLFSGGCVNAKVGDSFTILPEGLREKTSEDLLWDLITNTRGGVALPDQVSEEVYTNEVGWVGENINVNRGFTNSGHRLWRDWLDNNPQSHRIGSSYGICNSRRASFGDWEKYRDRSNHTQCPTTDNQAKRARLLLQIPVIANSSTQSSPCAGFKGSVNDPVIDSNSEFKIVGFVTVVIFDTDIGNPSPTVESFQRALRRTDDHLHPNNFVARTCLAAEYGLSEASPDPNAEYPFGFISPCNAVRARVSCNSKILGSTNDSVSVPRPIFSVKNPESIFEQEG